MKRIISKKYQFYLFLLNILAITNLYNQNLKAASLANFIMCKARKRKMTYQLKVGSFYPEKAEFLSYFVK